MALLANISFQDVLAGKTPVPRNQWFPTVQRRRYGSNRGKTMIQGSYRQPLPQDCSILSQNDTQKACRSLPLTVWNEAGEGA